MTHINSGYAQAFDAPDGAKRLHARDLAAYDCKDAPLEFYDLNGEAQTILLRYVVRTYKAASRVATGHDSYGLKHVWERARHEGGDTGEGFYITNAAFKGAMLLAGFPPVNPKDQYWRFKIQAAQPCAGRLAQHPYGSVPCPKQPGLTSGLCRYHANRKARHLPIDATVYADRAAWIDATGHRTGVSA